MPVSLSGAPYCTGHTGSVCQWCKNFPRYSRRLDQPQRNPHRRLSSSHLIQTFPTLFPGHAPPDETPIIVGRAHLDYYAPLFAIKLTQLADRSRCYSSFVFQIAVSILNFCLASQFTFVFVFLFALSVSFSSPAVRDELLHLPILMGCGLSSSGCRSADVRLEATVNQ